jgi:hypothetical protein
MEQPAFEMFHNVQRLKWTSMVISLPPAAGAFGALPDGERPGGRGDVLGQTDDPRSGRSAVPRRPADTCRLRHVSRWQPPTLTAGRLSGQLAKASILRLPRALPCSRLQGATDWIPRHPPNPISADVALGILQDPASYPWHVLEVADTSIEQRRRSPHLLDVAEEHGWFDLDD